MLLKPNMVEYEPGTAINTNPLVVAGAIAAFQRAGAAEVVVAEGPGHRRDTEHLLTRTGCTITCAITASGSSTSTRTTSNTCP